MSETKSWQERWRIIRAVAAKDILDAIKNKTTLAILFGVGMVMLTAQALPLLSRLSAQPTVAVYAPGQSELLDQLQAAGEYRVVEQDSQAELEALLRRMNIKILGLSIPAGTDEALASGAAVELPAYVIWAARDAAGEMETQLESHLQELAGRSVTVTTAGHVLYPTLEQSGALRMLSGTWVIALATIGAFLVPFLILEEKESHTMEALLVSPAGPLEVAVGKALAGLFYCLLAALVTLLFSYAALVHWGMLALAVLLGALLTIPIGLVLGTVFNSAQQVGFWGAIPMIVLLVPSMLLGTGRTLPGWLEVVLAILPSCALSDLFILAYVNPIDWGLLAQAAGVLLAWSALVFGGLVGLLRRLDR